MAKDKKFLWRLYYPYQILIILILIIFGIIASRIFKEFYISRTEDVLLSRANLFKDQLLHVTADTTGVTHLLITYDKITDTRITLISPTGVVIADSRENASQMELHNTRPEIMDAYDGKVGSSVRYSHTLQTDLVYVAIPVYDSQNKLSFVLRTSMPVSNIESNLSPLYSSLENAGIILLIIATLLGLLISRNISSPLTEIRNAAERFSQGQFDRKIYPPRYGDLRQLADSLNSMAAQLDDKLNIISEQRNTQQAVLESMKEGVLAVDHDEKILLINKAAEDIFSIPEGNYTGRTLQEVVRVSEIQKFFNKIIRSGSPQESEIIIQEEQDKTLQLTGTLLYDVDNNRIGVLVVLNDISKLKYLDSLKRDLVANVSHELKTPVTTIKGFIEMLQEGDVYKPEDISKFLEIISRNTDRLNAIIEDLLSLSRLEQSEYINEIEFEKQDILPIIKSVLSDLEFRAREKKIEIVYKCDKSLEANVNRPLLEQALENLVDNAIKYSDENKKVLISAIQKDNHIEIKVEDQGCGIPQESIPRLFERFYRVDKSRSRDEGGTGLGLAIVKHIAQVHNGLVEVHSTPGKGSIFSLIIPLSNNHI
jgi:two-component system phosphate regulon sensor histidine kinase PhoR